MKEDQILNEITTFCEKCTCKDCCIENDCALFRIEQIVLKKDKGIEKSTFCVDNVFGKLNKSQRQQIQTEIVDKINELIDEVNKLKNKEK